MYYGTYRQRRGFLADTPATKHLLIINVIVYLVWSLTSTRGGGSPLDALALYSPVTGYFHWWQPVSYMFMHGNFTHILFNMYSLWLFGTAVERNLGTKRYLILYFVAGLGAAATHLGVGYLSYSSCVTDYVHQLSVLLPDTDPAELGRMVRENFFAYMSMFGADDVESLVFLHPTVGASGAVYGLMMAFAMLFPRAEMMLIFPPVRLSARWMVIIFGGLELLTGVLGTMDGIAHFAHLGGMLFAYFFILSWKNRKEKDRDIWIYSK